MLTVVIFLLLRRSAILQVNNLSMTPHNRDLTRIFREMAAIYRFNDGLNRFRALAYDRAARVLGGLEEDISEYAANDRLEDLRGIGESIAEKIREYLQTGKIAKYETLKTTVPHELLDMMEIRGFGPQSLKKISKELGITTKEEIVGALQDGSISRLKGFGAKKVENMRKGLKLHKTVEDRMLLWDALELGERILREIRRWPEVKKAELAGSLRRAKETIGDIDILIAAADRHRRKIVDRFTAMNEVKEVLAKGDTKVSVLIKDPVRQVDLRIVHEDEWGSALQYFTGSKEHNVRLRTIARDKGFKISEYGVFRTDNDKRVAGASEKEIYRTLGFDWMPPEMREDRGELDLAARHRVPELVALGDIRGDLHMHTRGSDGMHTIEEVARYAKKNLPYAYIALADHSKSERVANGMDEAQFLEQLRVIEKVDEKLGERFVKSGAEVDILPDGTLDLSDELLARLDFVTASIHSSFNRDNTERIIKACRNPYVAVIGHPTGRLIGSREAYPVDMHRVIEAAAETGTALEINAQPQRMDLNDEWAALARERGVKLVISTDMHQLSQFNFMKLGVLIARRAWCTADDILNTRSWKEIQAFTEKKRKAMKAETV